MPILRLLFIVLVTLNLLALAAGQGWLGSSQPRGEPERITNQLNPERILLGAATARAVAHAASGAAPVLNEPTREDAAPDTATATPVAAAEPPAAEPPAVAVAPLACMGYGGMTQQQTDALEQEALAAPGSLRVVRNQEREPSGWWVRLSPAASRDAAERKVGELRSLGVNDFFILLEPGANQFAISLGLFKTEAAAQQHLAFLRSKGVRGAGIAPRHSIVHRIEIRGPVPNLAALADGLATRAPAALRTECAL